MRSMIQNFLALLCFQGSLFFLVFLPPVPQSPHPDIYKFFGFGTFFCATILLYSLNLFSGQKFLFSEKKTNFFALFVLGYQFFLWGIHPFYETFLQVNLFCLFFVFGIFLSKEPFRKIIRNTLPWIGFLLALYALGEKWSHSLSNEASLPMVGTLGNSNFLATFLAPLISFSVGAFFQNHQKRMIFPILGMLLCLFLTQSRAGWLGLFGGLFFLLPRRRDGLFLIPLLVGLVALFPSFLFRPYDSVRLSIYRQTLTMIGDHFWFGVGAGQFENAFRPYRETAEYYRSQEGAICSESDWLQWIAEWGVPGAFLWLLLLIQAFNALRKTDRALFSALISLLICGFFNFPMHLPHGLLLLFWLLGSAGTLSLSPKMSWLVPILAIASFPLILMAALGQLYQEQSSLPGFEVPALKKSLSWFPHAERYELLGKAYRKKNQLKEAQDCYEKTLLLEPSRYTTLFELGMLLENPIFFEQALTINPGYSLARYQQARFAWKKKDRLEEAIQGYETLILMMQEQQKLTKLSTKSNHLWQQSAYDLACIHLQKNAYEPASKILQQLLDHNPNHADGLIEIGILCCTQNDLIQGKKYLERALQQTPEHSRLRFNLGQLYYQEGEWKKAYALFLPLETISSPYQKKAQEFLQALREQNQEFRDD